MGAKQPRKAAPYSTTDEQETLAIDTFRHLIDHKRVKLDIKARDKYPNIDGYVELVDEFRVPIAKLEVQVKKLPDGKRKLQCPLSLFEYSEITCNPVLLVGVDTKHAKAYWVHVNSDLFADSIRSKKKTEVVSFPADNIIDGEDSKYIAWWRNISENFQRRKRHFPTMMRALENLSKTSNPILGIDRKEFQEIHRFLDKINSLLDKDFLIVKRVFYRNAWKLGFAYYEYKDNMVSYALYPIPFHRNDVQIKEISTALRKRMIDQSGIVAHLTENPVKSRPEEYAINIVESKTFRVLKNRLLNHSRSQFLAREFVFAFINKFSEQLGLENKHEYAISEIEKAFFKYLPIWTHEAMKFLVSIQRNNVKSFGQLLYGRPYFDPESLVVQIMKDEGRLIDEKVRKRIKRKDYHIPGIPLGNDKFPFGAFAEFLSFLKSQGIERVTSAYLPKDFSRLKQGRGWIWNVFSPDAVEINLQTFFNNLPKAYDEMVSLNFHQIKRNLPIFGDASKIIVFFDAKEEYKQYHDAPTIEFFHLSTEEQANLEIELHRKSEQAELLDLSWENLGKNIEIAGTKYKLISGSSGILDFIYDDLPMFNFIYSLLEDNLKEYFKYLRARKIGNL